LGGANVNATTHTGTTVSITGDITAANITTSGANASIGTNTGAATYNVGTGATTTGVIKAINVGTGGTAGSTTTIAIGPVTATTTAATATFNTATTVAIANTSGTALSVAGNITGANLVATTGVFDIIGNVRTVVQNSNAAATYTLVASDAGKHINYPGASGNVAVPISVFAAGDVVTIFNNQAANILIVQNTSVTLRLAGTASTGNRTLTQYGLSSVLCITGGATPTFVISGAGLI
jgi:hypothetical protein